MNGFHCDCVLVQVRYRDIEARRHLLQTVDLLVRAKRLELELQKYVYILQHIICREAPTRSLVEMGAG
jgi:hypothetical protein